jgi:hypothetical protein
MFLKCGYRVTGRGGGLAAKEYAFTLLLRTFTLVYLCPDTVLLRNFIGWETRGTS